MHYRKKETRGIRWSEEEKGHELKVWEEEKQEYREVGERGSSTGCHAVLKRGKCGGKRGRKGGGLVKGGIIHEAKVKRERVGKVKVRG